MCLGIPMRIIDLNEFSARCEAKGVTRDVSLLLLMHETLAVGDYLVVHLGQAIDRITPEQAADAWAIYDEILAAEDAARARPGTVAPVH